MLLEGPRVVRQAVAAGIHLDLLAFREGDEFAIAADRTVVLARGVFRDRVLAALVDQVDIDLVPVLLGDGIPFFARLTTAPVAFENPVVVEGDGVTHLSYRVRRTGSES